MVARHYFTEWKTSCGELEFCNPDGSMSVFRKNLIDYDKAIFSESTGGDQCEDARHCVSSSVRSGLREFLI